MIFIIIGLLIIYLNSVFMLLVYIRESRELKWFDWIIVWIPFIRSFYLLFEVEE